MKRLFTILCAAAAIAASAACNKLTQGENITTLDDNAEYADVTFNVSAVDAEVTTRAVDENKITSYTVLIFGEDEQLAKRLRVSTQDGEEITPPNSCELKLGEKYTIYAIVNLTNMIEYYDLECVQDMGTNKAYFNMLYENQYYPVKSTNIPRGFHMVAGPITKTFTNTSEDGLKCDIAVERIVSKIHLTSVTNSLTNGSDITIKGAFLSNLNARWEFGSTSPSSWANKYGRDDNGTIVAKNTSYAPELTYKTLDTSISSGSTSDLDVSLYCYPNDNQTEPAGWSTDTFPGQSTMLVLVTEIGGTTYYYPVNLNKRISGNKIEMNHTYDVSLTIKNFGSTDEPNKEVGDATAAFSVTAPAFTDGGDVSHTI